MSFVGWCERCEAEGIRSPVELFQISFSEAVQMCTRPQCLDFLKYSDNLSALFVKRDHRRCVTKAPVSEPAKAAQPSSPSRPAPLPTERCPLLQTVGGQDAASHEPAAHLSSKADALRSSSEAKASNASEVCCGGKMLSAEAVTLPAPTTAEPFSSNSVAPAMPVPSVTGTDACEVSLLRVGSVNIAAYHPEQSEPCRQDAPPPSARSHTSGEESSLPVATCGGNEEEGSEKLEDDAGAGIAASSTQAGSSAQVTGNGEERRYGQCCEWSWTMQGAEKGSSQVAALVSGDNSVPSIVHTALNEASEKLVAAAIHSDSAAAATCLSGVPPVITRELQTAGAKGTGHRDIPAMREANSDVSVSGCVDAGELNPEVSTQDPIASSLWIAETMFSLQCGLTEVAKGSVEGEGSAAVSLETLRASGVQFYSDEDAFRDSQADCMEIEGGAHQFQSEGTEYVDLKPLSPCLPALSQGPPSNEQKGGTTVQEGVVCTNGGGESHARAVPAAVASVQPTSSSAGRGPVGSPSCTVPAQRTPTAVSSTPGNVSTRAVQKNASAGRAVPRPAANAAMAGTSSVSGRPARKPDTRAPNRWANTVRGATASSPARTNKARQKQEVTPSRPEPATSAPEIDVSYVHNKFAKITEALTKVEKAPKCAVPGPNKPENKRMPGQKRRKDAWTKRQAGPQSQRPPSPKKVLRLAFGRPPKLRRKPQQEQVVPDVLHPALSPTHSDYSSQSSKPGSNCPSSPASCVSSGSDFSTTNSGSSSVSGSSSLQLDFFQRQSTAKETSFPPYQIKERVKAPVKVAKRGRPPRKGGPTDVGAEVDRYISELSHCEDSSQFDSVLSDLF